VYLIGGTGQKEKEIDRTRAQGQAWYTKVGGEGRESLTASKISKGEGHRKNVKKTGGKRGQAK